MGYMLEPEGVDLTVVHKHLSKEEAQDISTFIEQYNAEKSTTPAKLEVTATKRI